MRKYETFFILDPDLSDEATDSISDKLKGVVESSGGAVLSHSPWGKKKLAYPVNKHTRGNYILMEYSGGSDLVAELERNMRLDERVIKFITVKLEEHYDPAKDEARQAQPAPRFGEEEEEAFAPFAGEGEEAEAGEEEYPEGEEEEGEEE